MRKLESKLADKKHQRNKMKIEIYKIGYACLLLFVLVTGCTKNETHFYDDREAPGLGIFSNTGNNVFTCYIDGKAWRTQARRWGLGVGGVQPTLEVRISRQPIDSLTDFLDITWYGSYYGDLYSPTYISLYISVPKNFSQADFVSWQGQRLTIDGINSYFQIGLGSNAQIGSGTIYFNLLELNNVSRMSGLLEADFGTVKLTSGRFDHNLDDGVITFW